MNTQKSTFPLLLTAVARLAAALHCIPKITPPHFNLSVFITCLLLLSCSQGGDIPAAPATRGGEDVLRLLLQQRDWRVAAVRLRVAPSVTVDPHWDELHALLCDTAVTFYRIEDHLTEQPDGSLLPSRPRVPVGTYSLRTASPYLFIDTLRLLPSMGADSSTVVLSGGAWGEMVFVVPAGGVGRVQGKESSGRHGQ